MKALKSLLLIVLSIAFVLSALFLQLNLVLNCTVFSSGYFSLMFDSSMKSAELRQIADELTGSAEVFMPLSDKERKALRSGKASRELKQRVSDFEDSMKRAIDKEWLTKEAPSLVKGLFSYFTGSASKLPSVDISPVKDAMTSSYVDQFMASGSVTAKDFMAMISQIELSSGGFVRDGKVNGAAVSKFKQMGQLMGMSMSDEAAEKICLKIGTRSKDGSTSEELLRYAVKVVAADMLGGAGMQDKLNLNVLFTSAYGSKDNPVTGFSSLFGGLRGSIFLLSALTFLLLAGAIAAIAWQKREVLRWLGVPMIVSGVMGLVFPAATLLLRPQITAAFSTMASSGSSSFAQILLNWALAYAGGVTVFLLIQCLVFVGLGWLLTALARKQAAGKHAARSTDGYGLVRTIAAIALLVAIPVSALLIGKGVMARVDAYDAMMKSAAKQKNIDFGSAMMEALGVKVP